MARQQTYVHTRHGQTARAWWPVMLVALCAVLPVGAQQLAALSADPSNHAKSNAPVEAPRPKRLAPLRTSTTTDGARVTITADAALGDYAAYREGERFFVVLPQASFATAQPDPVAIAGLSDTRIEQRGADVIVSFHLSPGMTARVKQNFNRLDVLLSTQDPVAATSAAPATPAPAQTKDTAKKGRIVPPEKAQPISIPRFETPPVIDGKLDDAIWKQGAVFKDFYQIQPGDNLAPSRPTEMLMGYDSKTLYFAFRCYDEPDKVRATVPKRDNIFDDDYVGMFLDTFNDQRKAYEFFFSPLGVQADGILIDGGNEDFSPDIVMESKGVMTADGFTVEVAIPFKSLRYEAGKGKLWGAHFFRRIKRFNNELDSWMPFSRDISGNLNQAGHITGLEGVSTERTLELIPSITVSETGRRVHAFPPIPSGARTTTAVIDTGRFINPPLATDIGVNAKFSLSPTSTLDFAYNPDFAQVEADATVVQANQRFPIFFEEKRPFFLEGKDIFNTNSTVVHTRAIIDPDFAAKITGKRGRNTYGLLLASDNAPGNFGEDELDDRQRDIITAPNETARARQQAQFQDLLTNLNGKNALIGVLRLKHDIGRESNVGLFATSYNFIKHHNQLLGFDGRFKLNPTTIANFEVIGTTLRDCDRNFAQTNAPGTPPTFGLQLGCFNNKGFAYSGSYEVDKRHRGMYFSSDGRTRNYRADVGFTRRVNTNETLFSYRMSTEPKPKAKLISFRWNNFTFSDYDWQGRQQGWGNGNNFNFQLAHETFLFIGTNIGYTRLFAEEFGGRFAGQDQERQARHRAILFELDKTFSKKYSGYIFSQLRRGAFDFDFGAGPNFPRVSLAAVDQRTLEAGGACDGNNQPTACAGLQDPGPGTEFFVDAGFTYQPTSALRVQLNYTKDRLKRYDTGLVAFDDNIYVLRSTYQFTRFTFARARVDYDDLSARVRGQFLLGYTPNPGTAFYVGYNDDLNRNGFNPFNRNLEPGFRRNGRTFFIKASYLFRRSFEGK